MKKLFVTFLTITCVFLVSSCEKATPEQAFARAVINTNLMSGFAGNGMRYQLESPSLKLTPSGQTATMTRREIVEGWINSTDSAFQQVKKLGQSADNREMLHASIALYEYVLPVYRNEYSHLAGLYDSGAAKTELEAANKAIADKYLQGYQERADSLLAAGKPFAKRHGIRVTWDVQTSPSP